MPDVHATVTELHAAIQERLVGVLETRGADPQQRALRCAFLGEVPLPAGARVLEAGCGTGVLTRRGVGPLSLGLAGAAGVLPQARTGCATSTGGEQTTTPAGKVSSMYVISTAPAIRPVAKQEATFKERCPAPPAPPR
jgi:hypothetical protein